jgi:hypothetical protein
MKVLRRYHVPKIQVVIDSRDKRAVLKERQEYGR